ncbi:MAG: universal stress protein [Pseudomonadota bacterium]
MRSVLVHTDSSPAGTVRIETALSLARAVGGHVTLLVDTPIGRYVAVDAMGGGTVAAAAMKEAIAQDDAFARELDARVARGDVPCDVLRAEAEPVDAVSEAARLADVVIVARREALAGDLPLATRAPVLAVNDDAPLCFPLARAALAWDGSSEAAYALRCAIPLLAGCGDVTVLTVEDAPDGFPATEAVTYLSRQGIRAELQVLQRAGAIEQMLARGVAQIEPELLVMGAFKHSRLREFLFGGVTRHFLDEPTGPALLLAH